MIDDPNRDVIGQFASRPPDGPHQPVPVPRPDVIAEWNAPIDTIQADCISARQIIRGQIASAKEVARRWEPRPMPPQGGTTT